MSGRVNKIYAVYDIDHDRREIVYSWEECQGLIKGVHQLCKGFYTDREALEWFDTITDNDIRRALYY